MLHRVCRRHMKKDKTVFDTPEFLAEKRKWDEKLAKSGFRDIEMYDGNGKSGNLLRGYSAMDAVRFYNQDFADYCYRANQHYERRVHQRIGMAKRAGEPYNHLEAQMWKLHSRGRPMTEVAAAGQCSIKKAKAYILEERNRMFAADAKLDQEDIPLLGSREFQIREEFDSVAKTPKGKTRKEMSDE